MLYFKDVNSKSENNLSKGINKSHYIKKRRFEAVKTLAQVAHKRKKQRQALGRNLKESGYLTDVYAALNDPKLAWLRTLLTNLSNFLQAELESKRYVLSILEQTKMGLEEEELKTFLSSFNNAKSSREKVDTLLKYRKRIKTPYSLKIKLSIQLLTEHLREIKLINGEFTITKGDMRTTLLRFQQVYSDAINEIFGSTILNGFLTRDDTKVKNVTSLLRCHEGDKLRDLLGLLDGMTLKTISPKHITRSVIRTIILGDVYKPVDKLLTRVNLCGSYFLRSKNYKKRISLMLKSLFDILIFNLYIKYKKSISKQ